MGCRAIIWFQGNESDGRRTRIAPFVSQGERGWLAAAKDPLEDEDDE